MGRTGDRAMVGFPRAPRAFLQAHPGLYAASLPAAPPNDPELAAAGEPFVSVFFDAMRGYGITGREAVYASRGLLSAEHGFIMLERAGSFEMPVGTGQSFQWVIRHHTDSLHHRRRKHRVSNAWRSGWPTVATRTTGFRCRCR